VLQSAEVGLVEGVVCGLARGVIRMVGTGQLSAAPLGDRATVWQEPSPERAEPQTFKKAEPPMIQSIRLGFWTTLELASSSTNPRERGYTQRIDPFEMSHKAKDQPPPSFATLGRK